MKNRKTIILALLLLAVLCIPLALACADDVIVLPDSALEDAVRGIIGKKEGDITIADVKSVVALDLGYSEGEQITDLHGLEWFSALDGVCFNRQAVGDLSPLAMNETLNFIEIGDAGLTDLSSLAGTNATELLLYGNDIEDLTPLKDMTQLEVLVLEGNNITDVSPLAELTNLRVLILKDNPIGDFTPLAAIYDQLEEKDFEIKKVEAIEIKDPVLERKIRDVLGRPEGEITTADALTLDSLYLNSEGGDRIADLGGLEYFTNLTNLQANDNDISDISMLAGLTKLWNLELGGNRISDLSALAGLNIENLSLWGNQITDISPLAGLNNLAILDLCNNQVSDISALEGKTNLWILILGGNPITDFSPVAEFYDDIEEKDFELDARTRMVLEGKDPDVIVIFDDPVLEAMIRKAIGIPDGDITAAAAAAVTDLDLQLSGDDWSVPRITYLNGLQYFENLVSLNLGWALDAGMAQVDLQPISTLYKLQRLLLQCDKIQDISQLAGLTEMRDLELWANEISDLSALAGMTQMESLILSANQISDISVIANMPNLWRLHIPENQVMELSPLAGLENLTVLELASNPVWDYQVLADIYPQLTERDFDINDTTGATAPEDPDAIVTFADPRLEARVREQMGIPEGDITALAAAGVTTLDFSVDWNENLAYDDFISDISGLEYFVNLTDLSLYNNAVVDLVPLTGLVHLKRLDLNENNVTDISPLAGMTELEILSFVNCDVEDISALAGMTKLWYLYLRNNPVADYSPIETLYPLIEMTDFAYGEHFEKMYKPDNADDVVVFNDATLERKVREHIGKPEGDIYVGDIAFHEVLYLGNYEDLPYDEQIHDLTGLENCLNLKELDLKGQSVTDISPLAGMLKLEVLNLGFTGVEDISALETLTTLKWLDLRYNNITDLSALSGLTNLYGLYLEGNPFTEFTPLEGIYGNLTEKDVEYRAQGLPDNAYEAIVFTDPVLEAAVRESLQVYDQDIIVKQILNYETLNIGNYTGAPEEECIHELNGLECFTNLKHLDISGQAVTDLSPLAGMTKLVSLNISYNNVSDLVPLAEMVNLTELWIDGNPITDHAPIQGVYDNLENRDFEFGVYALIPENPEAVVVFADPVFEQRVRETMGMMEGDITARDAAQLTWLDCNLSWQEVIPDEIRVHDLTGIEYFINLEGLTLNFNLVSDISMLPSLSKLTYLGFGCNQYSDLGVFAEMPNLRNLTLFDNAITDISPLAGLTELEYLSLEHNRITDISPLAGMSKLTVLWLTDNPIEDYSPIEEILPNLQEKDF